MCFSAGASFTAGAVLAGTGVVSLKIADKPWQKPFATIPLLFAVQQVTEGFLWLSIGKAEFDAIKNISMYTFLVFAHVVWPVWVPFSMWKMEKKPARKKILLVIMGMGATVSIYLGLCMMLYDVGVRIAGHHVLYILDYPTTFWPLHIIFYVAAIVVAPFVSSVRRMPFLAVVAFISFAVAELLFREYVISVWCFFAAIISVVVVWVEWRLQSRRRREALLEKIKPVTD